MDGLFSAPRTRHAFQKSTSLKTERSCRLFVDFEYSHFSWLQKMPKILGGIQGVKRIPGQVRLFQINLESYGGLPELVPWWNGTGYAKGHRWSFAVCSWLTKKVVRDIVSTTYHWMQRGTEAQLCAVDASATFEEYTGLSSQLLKGKDAMKANWRRRAEAIWVNINRDTFKKKVGRLAENNAL